MSIFLVTACSTNKSSKPENSDDSYSKSIVANLYPGKKIIVLVDIENKKYKISYPFEVSELRGEPVVIFSLSKKLVFSASSHNMKGKMLFFSYKTFLKKKKVDTTELFVFDSSSIKTRIKKKITKIFIYNLKFEL
jgi:galactose-1-phosphate uridylyltransferase